MSGWYEDALLFTVALKATALLSGALLVTSGLRRGSAAARHLVWTLAFAGLLMLPVLSGWLPTLPVPVAYQLPPGAVFRAAASSVELRLSRAQAGTGAVGGAPAMGHVELGAYLSGVWAAGAMVLWSQMLVSWARLRRIRRRAPAFALADMAKVHPFVEILRTPSGSMPITFGFRRPVIFLPADAAEWSADRRRMVVMHELAHVRRGDVMTHLVARAAVSLYWWNPLAWFGWRRFLKERECAADDLVLATGARASEYAGHLLEIARSLRSWPTATSTAVAMARGSQLEGRVVRILDSRVNRNAPRRAVVALAACLATALLIPFAAMEAQQRTASLAADVDATIRAAASERNHEMLESAAKAAEVSRQYDTARRLLDSSLAIRADVSGQESLEYGIGLVKLGDLERSRNNFPEAEAFYTKAVAVLGNRPEAAQALVNLGTNAWTQKDPALAMDYFQRAQAADSAHAGPALMWMALMRERERSIEQADSLFKNALALEAAGSPEAALTMELYASFLSRESRDTEAQSLREQASKVRISLGAQAVVIRRGASASALRVANGVTPPTLAYKVEPEYAEEARLAKYQGTVVVSVVVAADGTAQDMKVVRGLGLGLDEQALKAIGEWRFTPGTKDGQPVPVVATIEVNFRLL
jgi:TonB family protein